MVALFLLALFTIFDVSAALSACDDVDIFFLIDKDSLIYNYAGVATIIEGIIEDGSSEDAAYSLALYGNGLTEYQLSLELQLVDTFDTHRYNKSKTILERLQKIYDSITENIPSSTHDISLANAFDALTIQQQPYRKYSKRMKFSHRKYQKHTIGVADDENRYFIFDHFNKLLKDKEICELFKYMNQHLDESIHFIMGQQYQNINNSFSKICNNKYTDMYHDDLFLYLNKTIDELADEDSDHLHNLERIFHLSCPAHIQVPEFGGSLHLTAHNQWIDPKTIRKCDLQHIDYTQDEDNWMKHELDSDNSFIYVNDHTHDKNTFKVDDYLLADPDTHDQLKPLGCVDPLYKIVNIEHISTKTDTHNILKLTVATPHSPMEYMLLSDLNINEVPSNSYTIKKQYANDKSKPNYDYDYDEYDDVFESQSQSESDEFYRGYNNEINNDIKKQKRRSLWEDMESGSQDALIPKIGKPLTKHRATVTFAKLPGLHRLRTVISGAVKGLSFSKSRKVSAAMPKMKRMDTAFIPVESFSKEVKDEVDTEYASKDTVAEKKKLIDFGWDDELVSEKPKVPKAPSELNEMEAVIWSSFKEASLVWDKRGTVSINLDTQKTIGAFSVTATGILKASYNMALEFVLDLEQTKMRWKNIFKSAAETIVQFKATVTVTAKVEVYFIFEVKIILDVKNIGYSETIIIPAGPVPVFVTPYIRFDIILEFPKIKLEAMAKAEYKESIVLKYGWKGDRSDADLGKTFRKVTNNLEVSDPSSTPTVTLEKLEFTSGPGDACNLFFGVTVKIIPRIGCRLYGALGVEAGVTLEIPIGYKLTIPDPKGTPKVSTCGNDAAKICGEKKGSVAVPQKLIKFMQLDMILYGKAYIKMPNFVNLIKQAIRLKKLIKHVKQDILDIVKTVWAGQQELKGILEEIQKQFEELRDGKHRMSALKKIHDQWVLLAGNDGTGGWVATYITGAPGDIKKKVKKRYREIEQIYTATLTILKKPFKLTELAVEKKSKKWELWKYDAKSPKDCYTLPSNKVIDELKAAIKFGCCTTLLIDIPTAHVGYFDDWYDEYDKYNQYEYDDYYQSNAAYNSGRKKQLNSAPVFHKPRSNPSSNPFVALMLLDVFIIFIVFICITSCICLAIGAFVSYKYHKSQKQETVAYNEISQNDDRI